MENPFYNSQYDLVRLFHEFEPKIHGIFDYLNGRINQHNICIYNIGYYSIDNYAQFQYPNRMTIFIGSIVDHYYDIQDSKQTQYDKVMSVAALCIAHELYHADQIINAALYKKDESYRNQIEDAAEYSAELFCATHINEFRQHFGFNYLISNPNKNDFSATSTTRIMDKNLIDYLYCAMLGTFRNVSIADEVLELCKESDLVIAIYFKDYLVDEFFVKRNGNVVLNIEEMNRVLSKVIAPDQSTRSFAMRVLKDFDEEDNTYAYLINIKDYHYDAFI